MEDLIYKFVFGNTKCVLKTKVHKAHRKACVGEYIQLIKPRYAFCQKGDIYRVNHICSYIGVLWSDFKTGVWEPTGLDKCWHFTEDDYVVLEGYEPE